MYLFWGPLGHFVMCRLHTWPSPRDGRQCRRWYARNWDKLLRSCMDANTRFHLKPILPSGWKPSQSDAVHLQNTPSRPSALYRQRRAKYQWPGARTSIAMAAIFSRTEQTIIWSASIAVWLLWLNGIGKRMIHFRRSGKLSRMIWWGKLPPEKPRRSMHIGSCW